MVQGEMGRMTEVDGWRLVMMVMIQARRTFSWVGIRIDILGNCVVSNSGKIIATLQGRTDNIPWKVERA